MKRTIGLILIGMLLALGSGASEAAKKKSVGAPPVDTTRPNITKPTPFTCYVTERDRGRLGVRVPTCICTGTADCIAMQRAGICKDKIVERETTADCGTNPGQDCECMMRD